MSDLVEAARRLIAGGVSSDDYCQHCERCITFRLTGDNRDEEHAPDCPWLAMPQIVAALEAAQALSESLDQTADGPPNHARVQALKRALRMQTR